jgi:hypothetical protein
MLYLHSDLEGASSQADFCSVTKQLKKLECCIRSAIKRDGDFAANVELGQTALDVVRQRNEHIAHCATCLLAETAGVR